MGEPWLRHCQGFVGLHGWGDLGQLMMEEEMLVNHCYYLVDKKSSHSIQQGAHGHWMGLFYEAFLALDLIWSSSQRLC